MYECMQNSGQFGLRNRGSVATYGGGWAADVRDDMIPVSITRGPMPELNSEIALFNFYRASELHSGLILGQAARRATDPRVILSLTRHSADEFMHACLLTESLIAIGGSPAHVPNTLQTLHARAVGAPGSLLEILAMTQIVARRTYHFAAAGTHPSVSATLRRISLDERAHLEWIKSWLGEQSKEHGRQVRDVLRRYALADQRVCENLFMEYRLKGAA